MAASGALLGLAVSGGPDSMALLALASAALPGRIHVATVDHGLREASRQEAEQVAGVCARLGIPHRTLAVTVPAGNMQDAARGARYAALGQWAQGAGLAAIATAHHADDQAETLVMRLNRSSGLAGLAGVRARGLVPDTDLPLLRPLLGWRRAELADVVAATGWPVAQDPSNTDPQFDRARIRKALAQCDWLDADAVSRSAAHLADTQAALDWAVEREWYEAVEHADGVFRYRHGAPRAVGMAILARIIAELNGAPRGGEVARLFDSLAEGRGGTLAGVLARAEGGIWIFRAEPPRGRQQA